MKTPLNAITNTVEILLRAGAWKATKYLGERDIVRATRKQFEGRFGKGNVEVTLTLGHPNFEERKFIKACKKAKESFPIKKIQLKFLPKKKGKR